MKTVPVISVWIDKKETSPWLDGINIHDFNNNPVKASHCIGIDHISPYWEQITLELVNEAHSYGMKVIPWTVNYVEDMNKLYDMGVDGMITDRPWILRDFLKSKGEKVKDTKVLNLPYHLEPDHNSIAEEKINNGLDAAY